MLIRNEAEGESFLLVSIPLVGSSRNREVIRETLDRLVPRGRSDLLEDGGQAVGPRSGSPMRSNDANRSWTTQGGDFAGVAPASPEV